MTPTKVVVTVVAIAAAGYVGWRIFKKMRTPPPAEQEGGE